MIFKDWIKTVYTEDECYKKYKTDGWLNNENGLEYYKGYLVHRKNGPAIIWSDGTKAWYRNGRKHRKNGPAEECCYGDKYWFKDGKRHREYGPAIEYNDGTKKWYLNDKNYSEEEYNKIINIKKKNKILDNYE